MKLTLDFVLLLFVCVCLVGAWILAEGIHAANTTRKHNRKKKGGVQSNGLPDEEDVHLE